MVTADRLRIGAALVLGAAVANAWPVAIAASVIMPALSLACHSRKHAVLSAACYYLTALSPVIAGGNNFFGPGSDILLPVALYLAVTALLTLPWLLIWSSGREWWRAPAALILAAVPPLGLIDWASPLTAAGLLFPGCGFGGVLFLLWSSALLTVHSRRSAPVILLAAWAANAAYMPPPPITGWRAVQTAEHEPNPILGEYRAFQTVRSAAAFTDDRVLIFPEALFPQWSDSEFVSPLLNSLRNSRRIILAGAVVRSDMPDYVHLLATLNGSSLPAVSGPPRLPRYRNELINVTDPFTPAYRQRIPVPVGMWRPWQQGGADLSLLSPGIAIVDDRRAAILICYETLLPWTLLASAAEHPDVFVGIANDYWAGTTSIPDWQLVSLRSTASLFGKPFYFAANRPATKAITAP